MATDRDNSNSTLSIPQLSPEVIQLLNHHVYFQAVLSYPKLIAAVLLVTAIFTISVIFVDLRKYLGWRKRSWVDELPGPKAYPVMGALHHFADLKQMFRLLLEWGEKYGKIYRFQGIFNETFVILNNVDHVQAVLSSNNLSVVRKPPVPYNNVFGQFLHNGLLVSDGIYWKQHRRIMLRAFTYKSLQSYIHTFNKLSKRLVSELDKLFPETTEETLFKPINSLIHCSSLQMICSCVLGPDSCDSKEGKTFHEAFQRYKVISAIKATNFWLLIDLIWKLHPLSREYGKIIETLNGITGRIIEKRQTKMNAQNDTVTCCEELSGTVGSSMVDEMLRAGMSREEILIEVNTVLVAGFESTSLTIHYMLLLLALNPKHQKACQEEVDGIFNDPDKCQEGNLTVEAVSSGLKYLERCCYETLRIFPVVFAFQRKPETSLKLDEKLLLPAGTTVIIPVYNLHRNPVHFPNPGQFDPDRFLPENCKARHPYAYVPFSAGIRNCIGIKFALTEIKTVVAHILRNFHVTCKDNIEDVPILPSIVMTPERDYMFHLKRRKIFKN